MNAAVKKAVEPVIPEKRALAPPRLPALTGYRALAAWLVYLHHHPLPPETLPSFAYTMLAELHIGVGFFFVLSGFLITYRYLPEASGRLEFIKPYLQNRFARIYPIFLLLTVFTLVGQNDWNGRHWLANLTLLKGFFDDLKFTGIGASWSLTVEECFYLLAPGWFVLLRQSNRHAAVLVPLLIATGISLVIGSRQWEWGSFFGNFPFMWLYTFFGRCFEFYCGMLLGKWWLKAQPNLASPPVKPSASVTYAALLLLLATCAALAGLGHYPASLGLMHPLGIFLNNFIVPPLITLFLWGLLREDTGLRRLLGSRALQACGLASYGFYLLHNEIFFHYLAETVDKYLPYRWVGYLVTFALLNAACLVLYACVEKPIYNRLRARQAPENLSDRKIHFTPVRRGG